MVKTNCLFICVFLTNKTEEIDFYQHSGENKGKT